MTNVNHLVGSRSHHRQRTGSVQPGRRAPVSATRRPPAPVTRRQATRHVPVSRPSPTRTRAKHNRRLPVTTARRRSVPQPSGRAKSQGNGQAFRKRAVARRQARIYMAGRSSRRLVAVFIIAAVQQSAGGVFDAGSEAIDPVFEEFKVVKSIAGG